MCLGKKPIEDDLDRCKIFMINKSERIYNTLIEITISVVPNLFDLVPSFSSSQNTTPLPSAISIVQTFLERNIQVLFINKNATYMTMNDSYRKEIPNTTPACVGIT